MKKNKVIFLATEIILCVLALFFTFKMFDQNETEKKVAVIVQNSGDKNWDSFIKGLKESAKVNNIHLIICNAIRATEYNIIIGHSESKKKAAKAVINSYKQK